MTRMRRSAAALAVAFVFALVLAAAPARAYHETAIGRSTNLLVSMAACGREDKFTRVAERCTLGGALSFPPPERLSAVQAEIEAALSEAAKFATFAPTLRPQVERIRALAAELATKSK